MPESPDQPIGRALSVRFDPYTIHIPLWLKPDTQTHPLATIRSMGASLVALAMAVSMHLSVGQLTHHPHCLVSSLMLDSPCCHKE